MATVKATAVAAVVVGTEVARVLSGDSSSYTGGCSNNSGRDCSNIVAGLWQFMAATIGEERGA